MHLVKLDKTREEIVNAIASIYVEQWGDNITLEDATALAEMACDGMIKTGVKFLRPDTWVSAHRLR